MRIACLVVVVVVESVLAGPARADRYTMQPGQTLEHVAKMYGCSVDAVKRANRRDTSLVPAGVVVTVPACRARPAIAGGDDDKARRALAAIDGVVIVKTPAIARSEPPEPPKRGASASVGQPWSGRLENGTPLPRDEGYRIRRPTKAFGADHVVGHLRRVIAETRALYPHVHELAIGDLSARHGGQLDRHRSHQSGLDVDVGFYFTKRPAHYPDQFVAANRDLDLQATWALIGAFARTATLADGVEVIFLDHDVQARLYRWARARGTPDDQLATLLQYPRSKDALVGLVRHWPSHADHLHVRFKAP